VKCRQFSHILAGQGVRGGGGGGMIKAKQNIKGGVHTYGAHGGGTAGLSSSSSSLN
jgi:hypothetical protein